MRPYRPSGVMPLIGVPVLLAAVILGGAILGGIVYLISRWTYLVFVFPIGMGVAGGAVIAAAVYYGKVRSPLAAGFCGLLITLTLYGSFRYAEYWFGFRRDLRHEIEKALGEKISDAEFAYREQSYFQQLTGSEGFVGYVKLEAKSGISFESTTSTPSSSPTTLKGVIAYGYWVIEMIVIAGFACGLGILSARRPFSEEANEWFGKEEYVATIPPHMDTLVMDALKQGNFTQAGRYVAVEVAQGIPRTEIIARRTRVPQAEIALGVRWVARDRRGNVRTKMMLEGLVPPGAVQTLRERPTANDDSIVSRGDRIDVGS